MAIQMTRQQYEQQYGVKPVLATSSVLDDEKPAPIRMTQAEYNSIYYPEKQADPNSLGSKLKGRGKDVVEAVTATGWEAMPGRPLLRTLGAGAGAIADVVGAAVSPLLGKAQETLSEMPAVQDFAMKDSVGKALDVTNKTIDFASDSWKKFEEESPTLSQDIKDIVNIASIIPGTKVVKPVITKADDLLTPIKKNLDDRGVNNVVDEIKKIENKYVKTRNANTYEKDVDVSRRRIAESNVLADAVDTDGVIRTKGTGGAIDQYKKQTIDGFEDIVKRNLDEAKEVIPFTDVKKALIREIGKAGLEGADLVAALSKIDKELAGLQVRTRGSSIVDLSFLHDAKIATTKNINYFTPPEKATYRKAVARAYKTLVEDNSTKFNVKEVNQTLAKYYKDIERLERLDGTRAEGGRLGKVTASLVGTGIGMGAGSVGGGFGAAVGGAIGGKVAQTLQGNTMARTFKGGGKGLAKDAVLIKAKLSIPDKPVKAKASIPKTKEIKEVESQIAKNVADQKKAIKAGDFTLVAALKEVYTALVDELKALIADYKKNGIPLGMSIRKSVTPESVAKKADKQDIKFLAAVIDDVKAAKANPEANRILDAMGLGKATDDELVAFAKEVIDEVDIAKNTVIKADVSDPKNYKTADEFVAAQARSSIYNRGFAGARALKAVERGDTYAKVTGKDPDELITVYRGMPKVSGGIEINDWVATDKQTAQLFAREKRVYGEGGSKVESKKVRAGDLYLASDSTPGDISEFIYTNSEAVSKTKSQLTDIWNKANGTKPTLLEEAKKYKSAEELPPVVSDLKEIYQMAETPKDFGNDMADMFIRQQKQSGNLPTRASTNAEEMLRNSKDFEVGMDVDKIVQTTGNKNFDSVVERKVKEIESGQTPLVFLDDKNRIIDGNHTFLAYKKLGYKVIPTIKGISNPPK